jgi:hypothetical protein
MNHIIPTLTPSQTKFTTQQLSMSQHEHHQHLSPKGLQKLLHLKVTSQKLLFTRHEDSQHSSHRAVQDGADTSIPLWASQGMSCTAGEGVAELVVDIVGGVDLQEVACHCLGNCLLDLHLQAGGGAGLALHRDIRLVHAVNGQLGVLSNGGQV